MGGQQTDVATQKLNQTVLTQPALFVIEYALAQLWMSWGIRPCAMIGYSIGEYVAAALAEVLSLEDALTLVAKRAQMIQELPEGAMLAVPLSESEIQPLLNENISLSAINGSSLCVIAGATDAVEEWERQLSQQNLVGKRLQTSHAFHSVMMEAIAPAFSDLVKTFSLKPPKIPYLSNVTGTWITAEQATDPSYWVKHLCQPVRFADGVQQLWQKDNPILLEIGPGQALISFASQCVEGNDRNKTVMLPSVRHSYEQQSDVAFLINTLGRLWLGGVKVDWSGFYINEQRDRLSLPTYPFEGRRYWIDANPEANLATQVQQPLHKKPNISDWFYVPSWKRSPHIPSKSEQKLCCLVFIDTIGVGLQFAKQLELESHDVITVTIGEQFTKLGDRTYAINPQTSGDYDTLLQELSTLDLKLNAIAHFWSVTPNDILPCNELVKQTESSHKLFEDYQYFGFYSLLFLAQALGKQDVTNSLKLMVVTSNVHDVTGDENLCLEKATVLGPCKVIPQEYLNIICSNVDIVMHSAQTHLSEKLIDNLVTELTAQQTNEIVAYRGYHRWVQSFEAMPLNDRIADKTKLRKGGVYLITGGLGDIGLVLAEHLAKTVQAKLILIGRGKLPERCEWEEWLVTHDSQDPISSRIKKVRSLEELGAEVEVKSADVTNFKEMQTVIDQTLKQFGQIHGVLHAAGIAGGGVILLKTQNMVSNVLAPKVKGTLVLDEVLKSINLDLFVLFSSINSIFGGIGQVDYCAANAFLDAYAHRNHSKSSQLTVSINWDAWQEVGMAVKTVIPSEMRQAREESLKKGILPQEGVKAFNRVLQSRLSQVVVSTQDLQALIKQNNSTQYLEQQLTLSGENSSSVNLSKAKHPRPNLDNDYVAPQNEIEQILADIWQQIIGIDKIGIHDNFFELGANSVTAVQIAAKANKEGLKLRPNQFFNHQTIAELAIDLYSTQTIQPKQSLGIKELHLTPTQYCLLKQNERNLHHCNQSLLLEIQQTCDPNLLEQALQHLIQNHDVFRLRLIQKESEWQQSYANFHDIVEMRRVNLSAVPEIKRKLTIESVAAELETSLNLFEGPVVRLAFFDLLPHQTSYLLIIIHQLAVDSISWRILLEDLQTAYQQLSQNQAINLPNTTTSYMEWAKCLQKYAQSSEMVTEQDYWFQEMQKPFSRLRVDYSTDDNTVASADIVSICLNKQQTRALLEEIHKPYNTQINDVLLTSLVQAFAKWTGEQKLRLDIGGNGREKIFKDIKLSRTVGSFTNYFPVNLDTTESSEQGDSLIKIKEYLRSIPNTGIGYGILKYLSSEQEIQSQVRAFLQSEVSFNYLGQYDQMISDLSLFSLPEDSQGISHSTATNRVYLIEINAMVVKEQLQFNWIYNQTIHRRETIENLAHSFIEELNSLIVHCQSVETMMYTPSDFPKANLSKEKLDRFLAKINQRSEQNTDESREY